MVSNHYEFTKKAEEDLDSILNYIAMELSNPSSAKLFFDQVFNDLDRLCSFPKSCPVVNNDFLKINNIRKLIINNFLLYYIFDESNLKIIVLRIVYGKRNNNEIFKNIK